jgi:catechol 2,3-dioxygenase-like lactoylglutathione lyase family enzyme
LAHTSDEECAMDVWFEGLSLPVSDLDRSVRFYESVGFVAEIRAERFCLLRHGSGSLGLIELGDAVTRDAVGGGGRLRGFVQVELGTDDLDGLHAEFVARGVAVHVPPRDRGFERQMQLRDPDGYTVEFAEGARGHNATR